MATVTTPDVATPDLDEDIAVDVEKSAEKLWTVIAHDDPFTTMDFVIRIMVQVFKKPAVFAEAIMWQVHTEGKSAVDALPKAVAERRVRIATVQARMEGFPFLLTIEPA